MRCAIMGNSGSGKTTLARKLAWPGTTPVLDLDTIAWEPSPPPVRRARIAAAADLDRFLGAGDAWIIEGCYGDLIEHSLSHQPELIFVNPPVEECVRRCLARPWEPHKFASPSAQAAALEFLVGWVRAYATRDDDCSLARHRAIFEAYPGPKREVTA